MPQHPSRMFMPIPLLPPPMNSTDFLGALHFENPNIKQYTLLYKLECFIGLFTTEKKRIIAREKLTRY